MAIQRPPRAPRDAYRATVWRYEQLQLRERRRRDLAHLVAVGPGWTTRDLRRPSWVGPAIDYVAVPVLWGATVLVTIAHPWLVGLYAIHLAVVYAALRWG